MPSAQYASPKKAQRHTTWHHIFAKCRLIGDQRIGKSTAWQNRAGADCPSWVKRPRALPRFEPLPRRWVIERTFGWLIKNRRLVRDFEQRTDVAETLIRIAATATMLRRVA
jgi:transposase